MRLLSIFLAALMFPAPAFAGETPWQEIAPGVQMRLIGTGVTRPDGTSLVGLEIDMPPGTKTYWRVPGQTGLPTELDSTGSDQVEDISINWPYPVRDEQPGYLDYVYFGHTVLPITVRVDGDAPTLQLAAVLGICSEICIPAQASFTLPLVDARPDRPNGLRIKQALALVPISWPDGSQPISQMRWSTDGQGLMVSLNDADVDPASLIASAEPGGPLFGTPQKSPQDNLVFLPILGKTDNSDRDGLSVRIAFMTSEGPFEVVGTPAASPKG